MPNINKSKTRNHDFEEDKRENLPFGGKYFTKSQRIFLAVAIGRKEKQKNNLLST